MLLKRYAILRYIGLLLGVTTAFLQPALFSRTLSQGEFAALSFLYGVIAYLAFCDLGMSKPIYATLRSLVISKKDITNDLQSCLSFYIVMMLMTAVAFTLLLLILPVAQLRNIAAPTLVLFAVAASQNVFINCIEYVFNALEMQVAFQQIDISRRSANIFSLPLLLVDPTFFLTIILNVFALSICCAVVIFQLQKNHQLRISLDIPACRVLIRKHWPNSRNSLALTINDTLIYNIGFIVLPVFLGASDIVNYSLWLKVFFGGALVIRIIIDIYIHDLTRHYFAGEFLQARALLIRAIKYSVILAIIFELTFYLASPVIFSVWVKGRFHFNILYHLALGLWLIALSVQSSAGVFLLSQGKSFIQMRNLSTLLMILVCGAFTGMAMAGFDLGLILLLVGIINACGSFFYLRTALRVVTGRQI